MSFERIDRHGWSPLKPGEYQHPATLLNRGRATRIKRTVFFAGKIDPAVALKLKELVEKTLDEDIKVVHITDCYGSSSGINLLTETDTGYIFGRDSLGRSKREPEGTINEACEELLRLRRGSLC
ncbi:hypothetical protein BGZ49_006904 [Haplosporangium sp. Z 27]|nr:hypothetical protein BGZ49_006904 [Haplosporangium sp. Z 27]